ncbi:hypothetical protein GCM10010211_34810 [Streptomyces albospinus]|uniref:Transposase n=1 Tax=Streptomyces albospinus TaxID=285515 RepID=A0ABQ2V4R6_9ACTN|nr:hypothetical protein [Streptomyces albospinus]GGU66674.1 hypothetical protein GCM10010211_34810 [Streptomyces albospinus]
MRKDHRLRRLVVGEERWLWSVRHRHDERTPCREVLSLRRDGTRAALRIVFRAGPGRWVPDGLLHSGAVMDERCRVLNLHEPGTVRRLLDEARSRGRLPTAPGETELDGWPLFDAIVEDGRN